METVFSALITGGLALFGVIITNTANGRRMEQQLRINQAVTDTKIDELTREVREHNNFAKRVPVLEAENKELKRRVAELEKYHH